MSSTRGEFSREQGKQGIEAWEACTEREFPFYNKLIRDESGILQNSGPVCDLKVEDEKRQQLEGDRFNVHSNSSVNKKAIYKNCYR